MNFIELEDRYGIQFCARQRVVIERGLGSHVWDTEGVRYLDFTSGWGVTCLGHAHPVIIDALRRQSVKVMQNPNSGFTYSSARAELLALLSPLLPGSLTRLFFSNSGAEANDAAIKLARKVTGKPRIVSATGSFHGRTLNTLSVSGGAGNVQRFPPQYPYTEFVEFGQSTAVEHALGSDDIAAVIVEPIQGEGGVRVPPQEYLSEVSRLCRDAGVLLIVDEIQTGFGRTGKLFALQHVPADVEADFLTLGKGIAGGFPFAALAVTDGIAARIEQGDHGGTYCGNPLGCAVSFAVINYLLEHDVLSEVQRKGRVLLAGLQSLARRYPHYILDTRGLGLMTAIELKDDQVVADLTLSCQQHGLLVTPTRNAIIRLIPDLLVSDAHVEEALEKLDQSISSLEPRVAAAS